MIGEIIWLCGFLVGTYHLECGTFCFHDNFGDAPLGAEAVWSCVAQHDPDGLGDEEGAFGKEDVAPKFFNRMLDGNGVIGNPIALGAKINDRSHDS